MIHMPKRSISIRYKILLLLTILPLIALALYLVVAIRVFERDKVAYVFESTSSVAGTLASQTTSDLNSVLNAARPAMQELVVNGKFGSLSRAMLDSNSSLQWIYAVNLVDGKPQRVDMAEKFQGLGDRDLGSLGDLTPVLTEAATAGRLLRTPFRDDRILLVEPVGGEGKRFFVILAKLPSLVVSFRSPGAAEAYLVNDQGYVLFGPTGSGEKYLSEKIDLGFVGRAKENKLAGGTEEVRSKSGLDVLVSFSRLAFGDLNVVTLVEKRQALVAVKDLIRQSILFFVVLISATTIVSLFAAGSLTSSLTDLFRATRRVAEGAFDIRVEVKSSDEVGSLANSFNAMAEEVSRLLSVTAQKARMESELKTAQTVQETLFPPNQADLGAIRISGFYEPASECGGDWWHYCQVGNKLFLWIGDATGHGAPAALITSAAKSAATIIERLNVDPEHALNLMNRAIYDVSKGRIMMTFFLAMIDLETREMIYSNASHEAPYLLRLKPGQLKKKDLIPLNDVNSPRLGQDRETSYEQTKVQLEPGDRILFYTDGIPDIQNPEGEAWGERNFLKAVLQATEEFPEANVIVQRLVTLFKEHRQQSGLIDDITFFVVEVKA